MIILRTLPLALLILAMPAAFGAAPADPPPWETSPLTLESGLLWQVGKSTSLSYRIVPTQLSWRTSEVFGYALPDGSRVLVRTRISAMANWIQQGPESYYVALNASPSLEWWNAAGTWSLFGGAGGGFGLTDSRGVDGGQGQDFTLHWFARSGMERRLSATSSLQAGAFFLHMSNLGMTDPNPGIDAVGFTLGWSAGF
jgi:lipid A 3-O-deacylase